MSQAGGGGGATAFSAFTGMSAAKAGATESARAATAASVNFFIVQPLPVVCGSGMEADVTDGLDDNENATASINRPEPPAPLIIMVKIQHAGGRGDKPFRVAFAAFLGDSGR